MSANENFIGKGRGYFVVHNPKRPAGPVVRHAHKKDAVAEAERLAAKQPGDEFFVLKAVSVSHIPVAKPVTIKVSCPPLPSPKPQPTENDRLREAARTLPTTRYSWEWR